MPQFRKKPVVIDAVQLAAGNDEALLTLLGDSEYGFDDAALVIRTLEGEMRASPGDWIIRGVQGECYPCKPDIFEATYEAADSNGS